MAATQLVILFAACATIRKAVPAPLGCERTDDGPHARVIGVYGRAIAEPLCVLDGRGTCHLRYPSRAVRIVIPASASLPSPSVLRTALTRRGVDAYVLTPRGRKQFASFQPSVDADELELRLGEVQFDGARQRASVAIAVTDGVGSNARVLRLARLGACWQLENIGSSALGE